MFPVLLGKAPLPCVNPMCLNSTLKETEAIEGTALNPTVESEADDLCEFQASQGYMVKPSLKQERKGNMVKIFSS